MIRKNTRVYLVVEPHIKKELKKEAKKSNKYITELLIEGWELYKENQEINGQEIKQFEKVTLSKSVKK